MLIDAFAPETASCWVGVPQGILGGSPSPTICSDGALDAPDAPLPARGHDVAQDHGHAQMLFMTAKSSNAVRRVIVRVELPDEPEGDYDVLHEAMRLAGFSRTIVGDSGRRWHLPHAVYTRRTSEKAVTVRDQVTRLARAAHPSPRVMVEVTLQCAWSNLREVTAVDPDPDSTA